jgi:hypothetical protein
MSQQQIITLENLLNNEKQLLYAKQQEKISLDLTHDAKRRQIQNSIDRASTMPASGPLLLALARESIALETAIKNENSILQRELTILSTNIERKEQQLQQFKNEPRSNTWSSTFK